jgi:hypothetical protein
MSATGQDSVKTPSNSLSGLISTLAPAAAIAGVYLVVFLIFRTKFPRFYGPRSFLGVLPEQSRSPKLKNGLFNWFGQFFKIDDQYVLNHHTLDGFLLLRFLKMSVITCFVGCLITWPVLFPINATGGGGQEQLDILSMSNVTNNYFKLFAHAGCAYLFFGFIMFMITRESIYYINLRQAYLMSPAYASRMSSRTVLYTSVPEEFMDEAALRRVLGDGVRRVWFATDCQELEEKVEERDKTAIKLEAAETKLITTANKNRLKEAKKAGKAQKKADKKSNKTEGDAAAVEHNAADLEAGGESGEKYLTAKDRPTHKLKFLIGKKVDTIDWCRAELQKVIPEVDALQAKHRNLQADKLNSVFVEFDTLIHAQEAYQSLTHHQALHMSPRYAGMTPGEVLWNNLKIRWWERVIRGLVATALVVFIIIIWSPLIIVVGAITNINYIVQTLPFLSFLNNLPTALKGVVTGLLPTVVLAILLALVPIIMRALAKMSGAPTKSAVELQAQSYFFGFLVFDGFIVLTLSSGALAAIQSIINSPGSAPGLLAASLPKASNFYINYFVLQGLATVAGILLSLVGLILFLVLGKFLDNTPRKMYKRWITLSGLGWGTEFAKYTLFLVIAICYACISPLVLGFATVGLSFFYLAYRYNLLFVANADIDCKGLNYPKALQHVFVGLYVAEVCLIGLFAIATGTSVGAIGPLILMIILLIFTFLYQSSLNAALRPLTTYLPKSIAAEENRLQGAEHGNGNGTSNNQIPSASPTNPVAAGVATAEKHPQPAGKRANLFSRFLRPDLHSNYASMRALVPRSISVGYPEDIAAEAYYNPAIASPTPLLWIPRDRLGLSARAVRDTGKVLPITDEAAELDYETNKIKWDAERDAKPPIYEEKIYY